MEIFLKVRKMGKAVKTVRRTEMIDYEYMTAPCGFITIFAALKMLGLDKWARQEAGAILDSYFYGT